MFNHPLAKRPTPDPELLVSNTVGFAASIYHFIDDLARESPSLFIERLGCTASVVDQFLLEAHANFGRLETYGHLYYQSLPPSINFRIVGEFYALMLEHPDYLRLKRPAIWPPSNNFQSIDVSRNHFAEMIRGQEDYLNTANIDYIWELESALLVPTCRLVNEINAGIANRRLETAEEMLIVSGISRFLTICGVCLLGGDAHISYREAIDSLRVLVRMPPQEAHSTTTLNRWEVTWKQVILLLSDEGKQVAKVGKSIPFCAEISAQRVILKLIAQENVFPFREPF